MQREELYKELELLKEAMIEPTKQIHAIRQKYTQRIAQETKEHEDKRTQLENDFLDKLLKDSNGEAIQIGMTISKDGKEYFVKSRYQQWFLEPLGNARLETIPVGKKRPVDIFHYDCHEYTIVKP